MSNVSIEEAIRMAQSAAAGAAGGGAVVEHTPASTGGAVESYNPNKGAPLGFDDVASDGIQVDSWLKINYFGFIINEQVVKDLPQLGVDFSRLAYNYAVRFGNPVQYRKTYDRVTDSRGGSWVQTLMGAQKIDPRASEYRSVDIPLYILEDVELGGKKFEAGMTLGYGTPVTGWRAFETWVRDLGRAGIDYHNGKVVTTLNHVPRKNDKGQWGIAEFAKTSAVDAFPFESE